MSTVGATLTSKLLESFCTENEGDMTVGPGAGNEGDVNVGTGCVPPDRRDHQTLSLSTELQGGVLNFSTTHSVCHCPQREHWSLPEEAMWRTVCFLSCLKQKEPCKIAENVT